MLLFCFAKRRFLVLLSCIFLYFSVPLCENSPLKSELILKEKTPKKPQKGALTSGRHPVPGVVSKSGEIVDHQPIVFKTKVRSSGYGSEEPR